MEGTTQGPCDDDDDYEWKWPRTMVRMWTRDWYWDWRKWMRDDDYLTVLARLCFFFFGGTKAPPIFSSPTKTLAAS